LEFGGGASTALKNVGLHFGTDSDEYKFAAKYFNFISKKNRQPKKISFAKFNSTTTDAYIIGSTNVAPLSNLKDLPFSFTLTVNGVAYTVTGDISSAASYADVAATLQSSISALTGTYDFSNATVNYVNNSRFKIIFAGSEGTTLGTPSGAFADALGITSGAVVSNQADAETITAALDRIVNTSNNFLSYDFFGHTMQSQEYTDVAAWNSAQNVKFLWTLSVTSTTKTMIQPLVAGYEGVVLTLDAGGTFANFMVASMFAAIDWERPNAVINPMFQQFPAEEATVTTDVDKDANDVLKINYLGVTQQAGTLIKFFQEGYTQGVNIQDVAVYVNEAWLKDAFTTEFINLLVALDRIPANQDGSNICRASLQGIIELAKFNGVIMGDSTLTQTQKSYIEQLTGDADAWRQVENVGYYLSVSVQQEVVSGVTKYKFVYQLVYRKGDSIRKVEGVDTLI